MINTRFKILIISREKVSLRNGGETQVEYVTILDDGVPVFIHLKILKTKKLKNKTPRIGPMIRTKVMINPILFTCLFACLNQSSLYLSREADLTISLEIRW